MMDLIEAFSRGVAILVLLALMAPRASGSDIDPAAGALAVSVSETPDMVVLHIHASGAVEPGSVEVQLAGRKTIVLARDSLGHPIRSQELRLPESVVEEGASAGYEDDGTLMVTLHKEASAQSAVPRSDAEPATP